MKIGYCAELLIFCTPVYSAVAKAGALTVIVSQQWLCEWKMIDAAALHRGTGLTSVDHPVWMVGVLFIIETLGIVVACNL